MSEFVVSHFIKKILLLEIKLIVVNDDGMNKLINYSYELLNFVAHLKIFTSVKRFLLKFNLELTNL